MFINGFLGLVSALGSGAVTELATAGYGRQPIQFNTPKNGVSVNSVPYTFGMGLRPGIGRAIWDSPSGGNLLLVLPLTTNPAQGRPNWDQQDVGGLRLVFPQMAGFPDGSAYYGSINTGTVCGTCNDSFDIISLNAVVNPANGFYVPQIITAPMTALSALTIARGELRASANAA